jgi:hypothetical protein
MSRIVFAPELTSQADLDDTIARCAWYLFPYREQFDVIELCVSSGLKPSFSVPPNFNYSVERRMKELLPKIRISSPGREGLGAWLSAFDHIDALFRWRLSKPADKAVTEWPGFGVLKSKGRVFDVDPNATRMEGSYYLWAGLIAFLDQDALAKENQARFAKFVAEHGEAQKAYVFGTGPTLSEFAASQDFSDGVCIAANSMVKNLDLLDRLKPAAIVAADPIFHAGCSSYAGAFQRELIVALERYDAYFITSLRDLSVTLSYLPEKMHERVIGIPFKQGDTYNVNLLKNFHVNPLPNILTLLLLPVAAALAKKIQVLGCDGRPSSEKSYFWSHDKAVQFNDEMDAIKKVHPAFFNIDYQDYYDAHCRDLERAISTLEAEGHIIESVTPSFIPALKTRHVASLGPDTDPVNFRNQVANRKANHRNGGG